MKLKLISIHQSETGQEHNLTFITPPGKSGLQCAERMDVHITIHRRPDSVNFDLLQFGKLFDLTLAPVAEQTDSFIK